VPLGKGAYIFILSKILTNLKRNLMDIFLSFRIKELTQEGIDAGITQENIDDSILWKQQPNAYFGPIEGEGETFIISPVGIYEDSDYKSIIVEMIHEQYPSIKYRRQIEGFIYDGFPSRTIPLHITVERPFNQNPMEGGLLAELNGYGPWPVTPGFPTPAPLGKAILEPSILMNCYKHPREEVCRS
jgi:hypothetical protein